MDFQHLASTETTALVDRLLQEHRAASLRQIQHLREALESAAHAIDTPSDPASLVHAFTDRLSAAVASEMARAREDAAAALDTAQSALDAAQAALATVQSELEAERTRGAELTAAVTQSGAEASRLESELQGERERAEHAAAEAAARAAEAAAQDEERRAEIERLAAAVARAEQEAARLSADVDAERERAGVAQHEAAALTAGLAAQNQEYLAQIERLTAAIARAEQEAARLSADVDAERERADAATQDLALTVDAHAEVAAALRQAQAEMRQTEQALAAAGEDLAGTRTALDRAETEAARLREEIARQSARLSALERQLAEALGAGADRDSLAAELEACGARIQALEDAALQRNAHVSDLETRLREAADAEAQLLEDLAARELALEHEQAAARGTREELDALVAQHQSAAARLALVETELAAAAGTGAERDALAASLHTSAARIDALEAEIARAAAADRTLLEALRGDADRMAALFDASVRGMTAMAAATTSTELLSHLVERLSIQFSRVALFRIKGDQLTGEQQIGFDEALDLTRHVLPLSGDSLAARAARSGAIESLAGADAAATGLPAGGMPTSAVSLPILLHGVTIAVVYADDADVPEAARGPAADDSGVAFAKLLVGHAIALLARHTHELKTLAELRDYAATLLQEARTMYLADVEGGRTDDVLRNRLKGNIDCASQLYAYRAAMEGSAAAALLDDQIAEEIAADTPFARDLARVMAECESLILNP